MENNSNVIKHDWGYELVWAKYDTHGGKILVFEKSANTDFLFFKDIDKTFFVNSGEFIFSWIDTTNGNVYQQNSPEGSVFHVDRLTPYSIKCLKENGSITESNSGDINSDPQIVIRKEILQ